MRRTGSRRRITTLILSLWLVISAGAWGTSSADTRPLAPKPESLSGATNGPVAGKGHQITLETERGTLTIELFPEVAPKTVARFTELAKKGFYDGLIFYRVAPKFLVQTGDPRGDGTGGSGQTLPAEFNDKKHTVGTVGMARQHDPDTADSQFYICLETQPFLDGKYTIFGQVVDGMDVLSKIKERDIVRRLAPKL